MIGTTEIIIVAIVVFVVFGATKLPQLGDGLGRAIRNFKRAVSSGNELDVTPKKTELGADSPSMDSSNSTKAKEKTTHSGQ